MAATDGKALAIEERTGRDHVGHMRVGQQRCTAGGRGEDSAGQNSERAGSRRDGESRHAAHARPSPLTVRVVGAARAAPQKFESNDYAEQRSKAFISLALRVGGV